LITLFKEKGFSVKSAKVSASSNSISFYTKAEGEDKIDLNVYS